MKQPCVYLLASRYRGTLYCGVTSDLAARVSRHRLKREDGFTRKYDVTRLVWFEAHAEVAEAIARETRIKRWLRAWKFELIEKENPDWRDLYPELFGAEAGFPLSRE